ncbi:hypothetical protein CVT25_001717 [Psilocybe cyanescens]|uniref:Uncharacterized protein n=1 Tax=Psilocybe cyanescens TaxID=93625 RepID=A0A409WPG1_PSICY|nr:hypothetical protein CVT25_001717 [Psilocybe cyanescens]
MSRTKPHDSFLSRLRNVFHSGAKVQHGEQTFATSPFSHLLKANLSPSEEEREIIKDAVLVARAHSSSLREDAFIDCHQSVPSVIRKFPDELLALIFLHCLPNLESQTWGHYLWSSNPSFRLSQVCQRWRSIATNDSRLWPMLGDIRISRKSASQKKSFSYLQFIKEILRRSKEMDLWIYIHCVPSDWHSFKEKPHPVINILREHATRWHVLRIHAPGSTVKDICEPTINTAICDILPLEFLRLRALNITFWPSTDSGTLVGFSRAPSLTEVTVKGTDSTFLLPLQQLRSYSHTQADRRAIGDNLGAWLKDLIKSANNLESLALFSGVPLSLTMASITMHIRVLELVVDGTQIATEGLLNSLLLPKLEDLKIASSYTDVMRPLTSLIYRPTISGLSMPLRKLTLVQTCATPGALSALLKATPYLEHLTVDFDLTGEVLGLLGTTSALESRLHIPRLASLVVNTRLRNVVEDEEHILRLAKAMFYCSNAKSSQYPFRLIFPTHAISHYAQVVLNGWLDAADAPLAGDLSLQCFNMFTAWRRFLEQNIPELKADRLTLRLYEKPVSRRKYDMGFSRTLDKIISNIEKFELEEDGIFDLYVSKIHLCLHRLSDLREWEIYGDSRLKFRERARKILTKWNTIILLNLQVAGVKWALMGLRSIIYVEENDPLRSSTELLSMVYGIDDCSMHEDERWSNHI